MNTFNGLRIAETFTKKQKQLLHLKTKKYKKRAKRNSSTNNLFCGCSSGNRLATAWGWMAQDEIWKGTRPFSRCTILGENGSRGKKHQVLPFSCFPTENTLIHYFSWLKTMWWWKMNRFLNMNRMSRTRLCFWISKWLSLKTSNASCRSRIFFPLHYSKISGWNLGCFKPWQTSMTFSKMGFLDGPALIPVLRKTPAFWWTTKSGCYLCFSVALGLVLFFFLIGTK